MATHDIVMSAAGGTSADVAYIDDVFSTYLYTGNGSTQTITNGIDLAGKGGMVWYKARDLNEHHMNLDTERGGQWMIGTNLTSQQYDWTGLSTTTFNNNGFSFDGNRGPNNQSGNKYTSWTFAKQAKFFDVVTYTGNGAGSRNIAHSLASKPGFIAIKCTSNTSDWICWARVSDTQVALCQNETSGNTFSFNSTTGAQITSFSSAVNAATTTTFDPYWIIGGVDTQVNESGKTYVAYLFAHDAGGFGTAGTDNVISCGSYTGNGSSGNFVSLGYEPQWVLIKNTSASADWSLYDNMRGVPTGNEDKILYPNTSGAEESTGANNDIDFNATGFTLQRSTSRLNTTGNTFIYIAIRRPMKPPTTGTEVFTPIAYTGNATANTLRTAGFPVDMVWGLNRDGNANKSSYDRLRGAARRIAPSSTAGETSEISSQEGVLGFDSNVGYRAGQDQGAGAINFSGWTYGNAMFRRAPGFFDVVCYTGTGSARTVNHNLGVAPELIIVKNRTTTGGWITYSSAMSAPLDDYIYVNSTGAKSTVSGTWKTPTSTTWGMDISFSEMNQSGNNYVAYLFASLPGVSKVGSYTGNGSSQTINCGFSGGARFFLVKRTDSTGDWWVYDSARGIVTGNDPALTLNGAAVTEVTSADAVDPTSSGIIVNQESTCNINVNSATYIYLAIA